MKKNIEELTQNITDYEQIIKEQRSRIIDLREENSTLKERVNLLEDERSNVAAALIHAEQSKESIIADAKKRAEKIIAAADAHKRKSELSVKYYSSSLHDLEVRCSRILEGITQELNKPDACLRIIK